MKKVILLFSLYFCSILHAYSCDPAFYTFCASSNDLVNEKIFVGKIVTQTNHSVELEIIENLRGAEPENTISVWDGTDIYCNGTFSMAVSEYGEMGDTIICIVQLIENMENDWDVIGDYRRPSSLEYTTSLRVNNGIVNDFGHTLSYSEFLDDWNDGECSYIVSTTNDVKELTFKIRPNPTNNNILIENTSYSWKYYSILSINGQTIQPFIRLELPNQISVENIDSGIYILILKNSSGLISIKKFVKI